jgi:hypothetical protein
VYIKGNRSFVNLDIAEHVESVGARGGTALKLTTDRNRELGIVADLDLERLTSPVISAGPVVTVICIAPTGDITAAPIAGWRVCRTGLEPLFVVEPPEGSTRFLAVGGHGLVRLGDGAIFPSIEQARAAVIGSVPPAPARLEPAPEPVEQKVAAGGRHVKR